MSVSSGSVEMSHYTLQLLVFMSVPASVASLIMPVMS